MSAYPNITILAGREKRANQGHPWIYSNELQMDQQAKALPPGSLVRIKKEQGGFLGVGTFNPHSLIAVRKLDGNAEAIIDQSWFAQRFTAALQLREKFFATPYYRLIHAEGDGLPGLVVDRYGDVAVVQANAAGMDLLLPAIVPALLQAVGVKTVISCRSGLAIKLEGLEDDLSVLAGEKPDALQIIENGITYFADPFTGQKTGWFYDQRDNRAFVAGLAKGGTLLDAYCYAGGFGLLGAAQGATAVTFIDSAQGALDLAQKAATANNLTNRCTFTRNDVMDELAKLANSGTIFDVVSLDPPAFVKSRKDMAAGLKGYAKLTKLGAPLVKAGGYMAIFSCSHHAALPDFTAAVAEGLSRAGRTGRIIRTSGAGPDHPVHPQLPEGAYLKCLVLQLD